MSNRLLTALLLTQSAMLALLVVERFMPVAHATETQRCEIVNWPGALTGSGFDNIRVSIVETKSSLPVVVKDWNTSDQVSVKVTDWATSDRVRIEN